MRIIKSLADDTRLAMLLHASANGTVSGRDFTSSISSSTAGYHVTRLRECGLLEPAMGRGEYRLSAFGDALMAVLGCRADASPTDDLLPRGSELIAVLTRRLPSGESKSVELTLVRP